MSSSSPRSLLLLCALLAGCTKPIPAAPDAARPQPNALAPSEATSSTEMGVSAPAVNEQVDTDEALAVTPFVSIAALCATQISLARPKLREADKWLKDRGENAKLVPSCDENRAAVKGASLAMRAPFYDASAITFEEGWGTQTDLVVRTADGWVRVPGALVYDRHDDPGCPSIVRERGLVGVRVEQSAGASASRPTLVVESEADRGWESGTGYGALIYSQVRACRLTQGKVSCKSSETFAARLEMTSIDTHKALPVKQVFKTTYTIDDKDVVHPASAFDLGSL